MLILIAIRNFSEHDLYFHLHQNLLAYTISAYIGPDKNYLFLILACIKVFGGCC